MGHSTRRTWVVELVIYVALMLAFGAIAAAPVAGHVTLVERLVVFGGVAVLAAAFVISFRVTSLRINRARPAAVEALTTLDLYSAESRQKFLRAASTSFKPFDTVGERILVLAEALRWSTANRTEFGALEPMLAEARECLRIERSMDRLLTGTRKLRKRRSALLQPHERKTLLCGLLLPPLSLCFLGGLNGSYVVLRVMLPFVLLPWVLLVLLRLTRPGRQRAEAAIASWLRAEGLPDDPFTVRVAAGALGRDDDPTG